jgi:hypothetical protein
VPDTRYTVTAAAKNKDGKTATTSSGFTTLKPQKTVSTVVTPSDGWTVGVGMPIIVDFTKSVTAASTPAPPRRA